jgi:hypothetical protein
MLFWAGYLAAQTAEEEQSSRSPPRPIEEITVTTEQSVLAIRFQLRAAEDAMFARFNELNSRDEFDIDCKTVRHTASYIPRRECEPRFLTRERQSNAIQVISRMRDDGIPSGGGLGGASVAGGGDAAISALNLDALQDYGQNDAELKAVLSQKYEEMNTEMFRIAAENPDFLRALMRVEAFRKALLEAREERFGEAQ